MRWLAAVLLAGLAGLPGPGVAGPLYAEATLAEYFRLDWQATAGPRGPVVTGQVENLSTLPVDRLQVLVERLDAGGGVIGTTRAWVVGAIPAYQRAAFSAPVLPAATYRVSVLSFDWANCRD